MGAHHRWLRRLSRNPRTNRTTLYDIKTLKAPSLVARRHVLELGERLLFDGSARRPLDEADVHAAARAIGGTARRARSVSRWACSVR